MSVVVVSYRPGAWLRPCLESVLGQAAEVILVDNGSANASASAIGSAAGAEVVRSERNTGFTGGANLGVARSTAPLVALLNDDAVAGDGWLYAASVALTDPRVAAVAPKILLSGLYREVVLDDETWFATGDARPLGRQLRSVLAGDRDVLTAIVGPGIHRPEAAGSDRWRWTAGRLPFYIPVREPGEVVRIDGCEAPAGPVCRLVNSAGTFLRPDGYAGDIGADMPDDGSLDTPAERFALSGTAFAFRREVWDLVGPLATPYFAYYEDIDWCWRARLAGMQLRYDPGATVTHHRSATSGGALVESVRVLSECNRTLTLVRNAPAGLARRHVAERWRDGPGGGVRRRVGRLLPWALGWRATHRRGWVTSPEEVWERWAGRDCPPSGTAA